MAEVVVVGAGPVGLLLAAELSRLGVDVDILERRPDAGAGSRAIGIHSPVLGALAASGITDELLADAARVPRGEARAAGRTLGVVRFDRLARRFPFVATLPQAATERVLAGRAPRPLRGARVTGILPRSDAVRVRAGIGGRPVELTAPLVVVASGAAGRGLAYRPGGTRVRTYPDRYLMADAVAGGGADPGVAVVNLDSAGVLESFPLPGGMRRYVAWDGRDSGEPAADDRRERLRAAVTRVGEAEAADAIDEATAFGVRRFVAPRLRRGRLFVIGDAAHEVSPIGGQGMNLGLLDAVTLAPLLAAWTRTGTAPERELERWERSRVASARTAAALATANTALGRPLGSATDALRRVGVRGMLAPPLGAMFARAYAMGFDRDA
ncbi:2-polyprenyl-6-methoxyphenol hydroxylase-like FAD-dependent oxidoreductase [Microbacterium terrae]|uniref:Pentachlorophenol 4-monooxygenase n=1 Tax=Microbacterium terrae TaxID=69369 RepID=A0A0M2H8P9_9MICO|nr:NAD(P)/FAD-dependent oxidoreductase [Microbacterium terrae]KJL40514.1 Pentachlorophenol 4-monooxygenase [Microbacterium terrae]MBP1079161.1 2-polyprenyl-6-methoxyphenol hydroxylase-like FAD-dependent oxidoreductase [Microbacterium terrae]GLJ98562.1 oxidoreductase [Microbacterium terrae]